MIDISRYQLPYEVERNQPDRLPNAVCLPTSRIAMVIPNLLGGGAERVILSISKGLLERGHHVDMITFSEDNDYPKEMPGGMRTLALDTLYIQSMGRAYSNALMSTSLGLLKAAELLNWRIDLLPSLKQIRRAMLLARYMDISKPNFIVPHTFRPTMVAQLASRVAVQPVPIVSVVHRTRPELRNQGLGMRNLRRQKQYWNVLSQANKILAVSGAVKAALEHQANIHHSQIEVVHNGVPTDSIELLSQGRPNHKWFKGTGIPIVLGVGRLIPEKDFPTLMRAFCLLRKRMKCRLVILGKGPEKRNLKDLSYQLGIAEDFDNLDFTDNPYRYMRHSSVIGLSSEFEGLPTVLLEALTCGCPCVSTDIGGPQEILAGGRYGTLVPVGDYEAMADALEQAVRNPLPKKLLQRRAEDFSVERCVSGYERVLAAAAQEAAAVS